MIFEQCKGYAKEWYSMNVVRRSVYGIESPEGCLIQTVVLVVALFAEECYVRSFYSEKPANVLLYRYVNIRNKVAVTFRRNRTHPSRLQNRHTAGDCTACDIKQ